MAKTAIYIAWITYRHWIKKPNIIIKVCVHVSSVKAKEMSHSFTEICIAPF